MEIETATFSFSRKTTGLVTVTYEYADGAPVSVVVNSAAGRFGVSNVAGRWKPCRTHAEDLVRLSSQKSPRTTFAAQRVQATEPQLGVFSPEG